MVRRESLSCSKVFGGAAFFSSSVLDQLDFVAVGVHEVEAPAGVVLGFEVGGDAEVAETGLGGGEVVDDEAEVVEADAVVIHGGGLAARVAFEEGEVAALVADVGCGFALGGLAAPAEPEAEEFGVEVDGAVDLGDGQVDVFEEHFCLLCGGGI